MVSVLPKSLEGRKKTNQKLQVSHTNIYDKIIITNSNIF